jgi:hypothetical protein
MGASNTTAATRGQLRLELESGHTHDGSPY